MYRPEVRLQLKRVFFLPAFAALEDPDAAPQRIRFRPELVVRASTGG